MEKDVAMQPTFIHCAACIRCFWCTGQPGTGRDGQEHHETTQQGGITNKAKHNRVEKLFWNLQTDRYGLEKSRCPEAKQQEALTTIP